MSIVFFGTPNFAVPTLKLLLESGEELSMVATQPDKPQGRDRRVIFSPVKTIALERGIDSIQPVSLKDDSVYHLLSAQRHEFFVVVAYGKILPQRILDIPRLGAINVHASLLPLYRGAAPIQAALINGDKVTGITTMLMDAGLDTGDILLRREMDIDTSDNSETLTNRLSEMGALLLLETIKGIRNGTIKKTPQTGTVTFAPPIKKEDGRINWTKGAEEIANLVRGLYTWPTAFCMFKGKRLKVFRATVISGIDRAEPGQIIDISASGGIVVSTGKGLLSLEELQPEGKNRMKGCEFAAGRRLVLRDDRLD